MRFYVVDNEGVNYGESANKHDAEILMDDCKNIMIAEGKTAEQISALELEVIEGN